MSAYLVLMATIKDPETYTKYTAQTPRLVNKYGGRFLARGGEIETIEGDTFNDRLVILEFPSRKAIHDLFDDPEYQTVAEFRKASSEARIIAVDGYTDR
jgi:uncharacterized protein (DUF1330 family)